MNNARKKIVVRSDVKTLLTSDEIKVNNDVLLSIAEDKTYLIKIVALKALGFSLAFLILLIGLYRISMGVTVLNIALILMAIPAMWACSKGITQYIARAIHSYPQILFLEDGLIGRTLEDAYKALYIPYTQIKEFTVYRQERAVLIKIMGDWVRHPSGYALLKIRYRNSDRNSEITQKIESILANK